MTHEETARWLLAILCGAQGIGTLAVDFNRTHATNPQWARHARFHLVWQAISYALLSLLEAALILAPGPFLVPRFYLAAALAGIPRLSFFAAFALRRGYGGTLSDPNGIRPFRFTIFGLQLHIDLNLAVEVVALFMLLAILALAGH
jgi:hypothetical protein